MSRILEEAITHVDPEHCKGCSLCIQSCPKGCLTLLSGFNSRGYHPAHYLGTGCTGCGMCFYACPEPAAITVYKKGAEYSD
jgi:ferredoxin